jgi:hypothetical protein
MMMYPFGLNSAVGAVKDQVFCEVGEETVILNVRSGQYFGLNPVGAMIWEWIQTPRRIQEVRDLLNAEFPDVEGEQISADLMIILRDLLQAELIEMTEVQAE